jgi:hypothetical protein
VAAQRCSIDGINFPAENQYVICPVCGEKTSYFYDQEPDEDYQWKATLLLEQHEDAEVEPLEIPTVSADVRVKLESGALWIHAWDLYHAGQRDKLAQDDLIQVGKQTFEILEYVEPRREYLVRPFSLTLSDEDLRKLAGG